jgi:hypothetical protein
LAANTQYLFIDVSGSSFYTVVPNTRITVTYQAQTQVNAGIAGVTDGFVNVYESPLIVKYRW